MEEVQTTSVFLMDAAPPPLSNVMIDLETWGKWSGCAIRSIGAVEFDPYSDKIGQTFYANILDETCVRAGLVKDASTVEWWSKQAAQAQKVFDQSPVSLDTAIVDFKRWWRAVRGVFPWSQGANFDQPILEAAMRAVGEEAPWKFWDSRCTRTAYDMGGLNPRTIRREGTHHNALDDAVHQARCVQAAYRNRGRKW